MTRPLHRSAPEYVLWEITLACNLRCRHCLTSSAHAAPGELTTLEALEVCDCLARLGVRAVALMGGEPLVRPDWEQIAIRLQQHGIAVGLVTNGWLFDQEVAARARRAGVGQIVVSLDGGRAAHEALRGQGTFDKALHALGEAAASGFPHRMVVTTVHRGNLSHLSEVRDVLVSVAPGAVWALNMTSVRPGQRMNPDQMLGQREFLELVEFITTAQRQCAGTLQVMGAHDIGYHSSTAPRVQGACWTGCKAGLSTLGITAGGGIKGCLVLPDDLLEGNVRDRSLTELWSSPEAFAYNRTFEPGQLAGRCAGCVHGSTCGGGCTEHALTRLGHAHEAPLCLYRWEQGGAP